MQAPCGDNEDERDEAEQAEAVFDERKAAQPQNRPSDGADRHQPPASVDPGDEPRQLLAFLRERRGLSICEAAWRFGELVPRLFGELVCSVERHASEPRRHLVRHPRVRDYARCLTTRLNGLSLLLELRLRIAA